MSIRWSLTKLSKEYDGEVAEDIRLVITVEGWFDIVRLLLNLTKHQSEFAKVGFRGLASVKRRWGAKQFKEQIRALTGQEPPAV